MLGEWTAEGVDGAAGGNAGGCGLTIPCGQGGLSCAPCPRPPPSPAPPPKGAEVSPSPPCGEGGEGWVRVRVQVDLNLSEARLSTGSEGHRMERSQGGSHREGTVPTNQGVLEGGAYWEAESFGLVRASVPGRTTAWHRAGLQLRGRLESKSEVTSVSSLLPLFPPGTEV